MIDPAAVLIVAGSTLSAVGPAARLISALRHRRQRDGAAIARDLPYLPRARRSAELDTLIARAGTAVDALP